MRGIIFFSVFLLVLHIASAAVIFGDVYDISLSKAENVIVKINTEPEQQYVAKNGTYAFDVSKGDYTIRALYSVDGVVESSAQEAVSVKDEGNYRLDIILFPNIEEESSLLEESNIEIDALFEEKYFSYSYLWIVVIVLALFCIFFYLKRKSKKQKDEQHEEAKKEMPDLRNVLEIIKKGGGRATQKEIRKQIPLSEAKISLMIAELESEGKIKKIKKGRGNILVLR